MTLSPYSVRLQLHGANGRARIVGAIGVLPLLVERRAVQPIDVRGTQRRGELVELCHPRVVLAPVRVIPERQSQLDIRQIAQKFMLFQDAAVGQNAVGAAHLVAELQSALRLHACAAEQFLFDDQPHRLPDNSEDLRC